MNRIDAYPLIRWAGSKRQLIPYLLDKVPRQFGTYIEPFAGSACLFFAISPVKALLSDLNSGLIETYRTTIRHPIKVLRLARSLGTQKREYYRIRAIDPTCLSPIGRAAQFLYLNRHCFNALYRTNKSGHFNVPKGSKTGAFLDEISFRRSAAILKRAKLACCDFEVTLAQAIAGDFVYLDPPYALRKGSDRNVYGCGTFSDSDLPRLARSLADLHRRRIHFLLSYSYSPKLLELLGAKAAPVLKVRRRISAKIQGRGFAREILLSNADLFGTSF